MARNELGVRDNKSLVSMRPHWSHRSAADLETAARIL
jgi:hypothetical protein